MEAIDGRSDKSRNGGAKGSKKTRKNLQRAKYIFVRSAKRSDAYREYFNPDRAVEIRVMGFENTVF
jgi:meiosis-specific protein